MNANLKKVIKDLELEESKLKSKKDAARRTAIEEINELIALFGFKQSDLDFSGKAPVRASRAAGGKGKRAARSDSGKKVEPKYMAPDGTTWTGRGKKPRAIAEAIEAGFSLEDMLIKKEVTADPS